MESLLEFSKYFSSWVEQAKESLSYPVGPPKNLVAEFEAAKGNVAPTEIISEIHTSPSDVVSQSSLFKNTDTTVQIRADQGHIDQISTDRIPTDRIITDRVDLVRNVPSEETNLLRSVQKTQLSDQERINLEKGLETISSLSDDSQQKKVADTLQQETQKILDILQKKTEQLSPLDLLQVQRYASMLSFSAESGKKTSEAISETIETILDMDG